MKYLFIGLMAFMIGCTTEKPVQVEQPTNTTQAPIQETGEKPVKVNEDGLNVGQLIEVGNKMTWRLDDWHGNRPDCKETDVEGGVCDMSVQGCQKPNGKKMLCDQQKTYKIYGWIYHKEGLKYTPLADAEISRYWFAGSWVGFTDIHVLGKTNKFGYYEVYTSDLKDTLRVKKEGYFSMCNKSEILVYSGQHLNRAAPAFIEPMILKTVTNDSCK